MRLCAAICFHGCVCKDCMICISLHGEPESHSGMLIARLMMVPCPALPGQKDVGLRECRSSLFPCLVGSILWGFHLCCRVPTEGRTAPPLGSTPCLSLSFCSLLAPDPHCYAANYSCSSTCHLKMAHPTAPPLATSFLQLQNDKEPEKHFSSSLSLPHSESEYTVSCSAHGKRKKKLKGASTLHLF